MATNEVVLALLRNGPAHGYDIKRDHDSWFPDARPLAFGQVYATLGRLNRSGHVEVLETRSEGGPERTVYALTERGEEQLRDWLAEPAGPAASSTDEIVRKTVAALRTGTDAAAFLALQRTAHLRRIRELTAPPDDVDPAARLARDHLITHLDADLRWLDLAFERIAAGRHATDTTATATAEEATR
ncbi:PadR family transcriptional regulator [soil metagenome]